VAERTVRLKVKRQDAPNSKPYWQEFELRWRPGMNVITALMDIAADPVDRWGRATQPITYESNCLEEVCGSCAMLIKLTSLKGKRDTEGSAVESKTASQSRVVS
jgi:succinate dehydrogenase / fumarate reductase iron-sulfur subunit